MADEVTITPPGSVDPNASVEVSPVEKVLEPTVDDKHNDLINLKNEELVQIIKDTRSEAKTRRLKQRELEGQISEAEKKKLLEQTAQDEENQRWEKLYTDNKEATKDYEDLKIFKEKYIRECTEKIEAELPKLSQYNKDLFEISKKNMTIEDQLKLIDKLSEIITTNIDGTQSTARITDNQYSKDDLLKDVSLMAQVKEKNPTLYKKYFPD